MLRDFPAPKTAQWCERRHGDGDCPRPYRRSGECICDLRRLSRTCSDWAIAVLVGCATYAQLLDAGPGLFEPFAEFRTDGNTASSIGSVAFEQSSWRRGAAVITEDHLPREFGAPIPPNLVSTILVDGGLTVGDLKRLLVRAASGLGVHPSIAPLVGSSRSYRSPELSLGEITAAFAIYAAVVAIIIACCLRSFRTSKSCGRIACA